MSVTEIMAELPLLTEEERRSVRERLLEIANSDEGVAACNEAALQGAIMLDKMEEEDAHRKSR